MSAAWARHAMCESAFNVFNTVLVANQTNILTYHSLQQIQLAELEDKLQLIAHQLSIIPNQHKANSPSKEI